MKCPSCGYENSEDARYCNLCQASFVREPSASYGLPSLAEPKKEGVKAARTVLKSQSTGENWFQRHLNWTWVLAQLAVGLIAYFVVTVFVASLFVTSTTLPSEESLLASVSVLQIMGVVLQLIAMFGVGVWVLKRKDRNLIWLLIFLVPLVGWLIFLCLENRSQPPALPVSSRPSSSIQPGLAPQGLGSQYRKYEP